jgi:hypothetical protein
MLDGTMWRGTVETGHKVAGPGQMFGDGKQLYFESDHDKYRGTLNLDAVKAIYIGAEDESGLPVAPRFFDAAPIPASLWVRVRLIDGEIVEGMIANAWSAFSGELLELRLPGEQYDQRQMLIPRTSIAELHVITIR